MESRRQQGHSTGRNLKFLTKPSSTQCVQKERNPGQEPAWCWRADKAGFAGCQSAGRLQDILIFHTLSGCFTLQVIKQRSRAAGYEPNPEAEAPRFCISTSARTAWSINRTFSSLSHFLFHLFVKLTQKHIFPTKTSMKRSESICNKNLCCSLSLPSKF